MQFRVRTMLVVVATVSCALAVSGGLGLVERAILGVCIAGIWAGVALLVWGFLRLKVYEDLDRIRDVLTAYVLLICGTLVASFALGGSAMMFGLAMRAGFNSLWTHW